MKYFFLFFSIPFLFLTPSWALDTTEEYPPGFSNFEGYSMQSRHEQTLSVLAGYGQSRWLNLSLGVDQVHDVTADETQMHFCVGNFSHIYDGIVDSDLILQLHSQDEKTTSSLGTEISYDYDLWTPYLKMYTDITEDQHSETASVGLSRRIPQMDLELLVEYSQVVNETHPSTALGLNYKSNDNFELITEVAHQKADENTSVSVGFIINQ